jgi:hypothetical protein
MLRFPKTYILLIAGARWAFWLVTLALVWRSGALIQPESDTQPLLWMSYLTLYTLLWTLQLPRFVARAREGSVIVLYDLLLSALPIWFSGGWSSPFLPALISVILVPAMVRGWSGGLLVAAAVLAMDQTILWTTALNPWVLASNGQSLALLGRTLLPFGVTAAIVLSGELWRWWRDARRHRARQARLPLRLEYPPVQSLMERPGDDAPLTYDRPARSEPALARTWSKERASQSTLERRAPATVQAALRHYMADFQSAGVILALQIEGDERQLPTQIRELLIKAIEIALDNVLSHARAREAQVALEMTPGAVALRVCDDGIGLFDGTAEPPGFHQIKRLRFRAQELGGELRVAERDEGGVELHLQVPFVV